MDEQPGFWTPTGIPSWKQECEQNIWTCEVATKG
jgi:hypothetical protein